jgi:hypothetical protein
VALVGIRCFILFISDCFSSVVAGSYLPRGILSADDSVASRKAECKIVAANWKWKARFPAAKPSTNPVWVSG